MKRFEMTCVRMYSLVLIFIGLPVVMLSFAGIIILSFNDIPDWAIAVIMFLIITYLVILAIYLIRKFSNTPCLVYLSEEGIKIALQKSSVFFPGKEFESRWEAIREANSSYEPQKQCRFYKITFTSPQISIYLDSKEKLIHPEEETEFGTLLMNYVSTYNKNIPADTTKPIDTRNFYQASWAKNLTRLVWVILFGLIIIKVTYPELVDFWRITQFSIFSAIWLLAYHLNNKKK